MSFRFEEKILLHISDYHKIKDFIFSSGGKNLFKKRKISSLYFDNNQNNMYLDSEDGTLPRKKIRIRKYPNNTNDDLFFETKISSVEGRFKIVKKINRKQSQDYVKKGYFDVVYGFCFPKIEISYFREYFSFLNQRITLDNLITYRCFKSNRVLIDKEILILEIKSKNAISIEKFKNAIPLQRLRISKYCHGVNILFNKNEYQRLNQIN
tara:strand:- start:938 stop:1564 length:627 start_codon:yes stop_codon:yes gene_type:complete